MVKEGGRKLWSSGEPEAATGRVKDPIGPARLRFVVITAVGR